MRNRLSNVLWGLFFILVGVGIAGNVMDIWDFELFFEGWWTLFIIIPCFISMIQGGFGVGSTMGFIIGILLLLNSRIDFDIDLWSLIVPIILVFIGIRIMFPRAFQKHPKFIEQNMNVGENGSQEQYYSSATKAEYSAVFSSNRIHVTDQFYGTNVNAVFGGLVLDLRDAVIKNDVEVNASAVFGGIDIYLPYGVKVKSNNIPIFGGVSNKAQQSTDPSAPTIYLNATCMFGGIDIK